MLRISATPTMQSLLTKAQCPACRQRQLELRIRCETPARCEYWASCASCELAFETRATQPSSELEELIPHLLCPACHHRGGELSLACHLDTRVCEPTVRCTHCERILLREPQRPLLN